MAAFINLSRELLETTFSFLDRYELLNLCLTCRELLPLARRQLFRHIVLKTHRGSDGRPFVLDIKKVLDRQNGLALCVQSIQLFGQKPDPLWHESSDEDEVFPRRPYKGFHGLEEVLIKPLRSKSDKCYIDLIAQLHNLQIIKLGFTFFALALKFEKHFCNLCSFILENDACSLKGPGDNRTLLAIDPCLFIELCRLPCIANLDLEVPYNRLMPIRFDGLHQMPSLSSLVLRETVIDPSELSILLANTPT
ncbi:MAG: hypothetical protein M1820_002282 [Bogoriella megaspora]|nr:MAG: hypothetical protein M1820_002282 [Bogoriella megaspora]